MLELFSVINTFLATLSLHSGVEVIFLKLGNLEIGNVKAQSPV
jgi:hypothetical protein